MRGAAIANDVIDGQEMGTARLRITGTGRAQRLALLKPQTDAAPLAGRPTDPNLSRFRQGCGPQRHSHRHAIELLKGLRWNRRSAVPIARRMIFLDYLTWLRAFVGVMMAMIMVSRD